MAPHAPVARSRLTSLAWIAALALAFLPFLFVSIPPLADAPGHLGQLAVQAAAPGSPLRHYFGFAWGLRLNLGTDLLVDALDPVMGLAPAFWLVCAIVPMLTVAAIALLARSADRKAAAASFALPFAFAYPFSFGFINYSLGMALALIAFAGWIGLAERPRLREALYWVIIPALMICHAVGGGLLPVMIVADSAARTLWQRPNKRAIRAFLIMVRPLLAAIPLVVLAHGPAGGGFSALFSLNSKASAIVLALRDQNRLLDIGSVALIIAAPMTGLVLGARYRRTDLAVVLALALLFLVMPAELNGSAYNDMRLVPPLAIAALALMDWSRVDRRWATSVLLAGFALFAVRMAVTTRSFAAYAHSYSAEMRALPHIARGSRVLALVTRQCKAARAWRMDRLDHLPVLATVEREAWTNALWDVPSIHLLQIAYRPSAAFYHDPSHYVWPDACVDPSNAWERQTIAHAAPLLPLDKVDYLWLIQATLPGGPWDSKLVPVWSADGSTLYRTRLTPLAFPARR